MKSHKKHKHSVLELPKSTIINNTCHVMKTSQYQKENHVKQRKMEGNIITEKVLPFPDKETEMTASLERPTSNFRSSYESQLPMNKENIYLRCISYDCFNLVILFSLKILANFPNPPSPTSNTEKVKTYIEGSQGSIWGEIDEIRMEPTPLEIQTSKFLSQLRGDTLFLIFKPFRKGKGRRAAGIDLINLERRHCLICCCGSTI